MRKRKRERDREKKIGRKRKDREMRGRVVTMCMLMSAMRCRTVPGKVMGTRSEKKYNPKTKDKSRKSM